MSIKLYEHNKIAYDSVVEMLDNVGKAAVIHPTGTGKSFIGFKLCEDNPDKTICWLSPSQYIFTTQLENYRAESEDIEDSIFDNIKFYTYAKLMNMNLTEFEDIKPDYIILDEFHRCGAVEWGQGVDRLIEMYDDVPILGFSATAIRYLDNQRDIETVQEILGHANVGTTLDLYAVGYDEVKLDYVSKLDEMIFFGDKMAM